MWKSVPVLLGAALLAITAWAQSTGNLEPYLRADHPDSYTVQKGDTLWDISGRFLAEAVAVAGAVAGEPADRKSASHLSR